MSQTENSVVVSTVPLLQQSGPDRMYSAGAQPTEHQAIEGPVSMNVDSHIDVSCNPNCHTLTQVPSSPLSPIPSSEPSDPQETQFQSNFPVEDTSTAACFIYKSKSSSLLESQGPLLFTAMQKPSKLVSDLACETVDRSTITLSAPRISSLHLFQGANLLDLDPMEVDHTHSPVSDHNCRIDDVNGRSEPEQSHSPVSNRNPNIDDVDSESAPGHIQVPTPKHKRTIDDVDSESEPEFSRSSGANHKRKINSFDGESELSDATTSDTGQDTCSGMPIHSFLPCSN